MSVNQGTIEAYPLSWPPGRPRTKNRTRAIFHRRENETYRRGDGSTYTSTRSKPLSVADSRDRVIGELSKFGARGIIISSNLRLRNDGLPMSAQREPDDPGVAVYFQLDKHPHSLSCDRWDRAADNLAAIAKHVEAMRGQIRWGVADVAAMFAGFKALPGAIITPVSMTTEDAAAFISTLIGAGDRGAENIRLSPDTFRSCYREAAGRLHPDKNGGIEKPDWHTLQKANEALKLHHGI